jgi:hypothetical protein
MSWLVHHSRSEEYASQAENFYRQQELNRSTEFYRLAAEAEVKALQALDPSKSRTIGITVVSAASLYFKAREFLQAKRIAYEYLATDLLPPFAVEELEELVQVIHYEELSAKSGIQFIEGEVLVSVSGGEIMYGAAPLELVLRKVEEISKLFYRTTEMLLDIPLRKHGAPNQSVKTQCNPWLFQAPPGSYQFAVRVRKPQEQLVIPGVDVGLRVEQITKKFLEIIRAATQDPEGELIEVVPNQEYRETFMKLTRNLAPPATGKSFKQMEIKSTQDIEPHPVILLSDTREVISNALRKAEPVFIESPEQKIIQLRGTLRGLQLDDDWIEVNIDGESKNRKIYDAKEEIDDVIGSMVNRRVIVEVVEHSERYSDKKYFLRDLQAEEDLI